MVDFFDWYKVAFFRSWINRLRAYVFLKSYKFKHWAFRWNCEAEQDGSSIVFTLFNHIHFLKYKEHTLINFGHPSKFNYTEAIKYVNARKELSTSSACDSSYDS